MIPNDADLEMAEMAELADDRAAAVRYARDIMRKDSTATVEAAARAAAHAYAVNPGYVRRELER